ncbi:MAG: polysaccharide deacetylase family protein [Actinobacteria bacterium]|nr:polysaccharide deacetylase family protein [Actinomycetota bacterium]
MRGKLFAVLLLLFTAFLICLAPGEAGDSIVSPAPADSFKGVPILMYHKVNPDSSTGGYGLRVRPRDFERQMAYLSRNGYRSVSLSSLADHHEKGSPLPPRPVVITLDDGYLDNYTYAYPILKKYGLTATIFVVSGTVGGINQFDYRAGRQPKNKMAGWPQLREMAGGGIAIGAHTVRHPRLGELSPGEVRSEVAGSKRVLEKELHRPVEVFCYPYGSYNETVAGIVRESGFRAAVTTAQGLGRFAKEPFTLRRIRVRGDYSLQRFMKELSGYNHSRAG